MKLVAATAAALLLVSAVSAQAMMPGAAINHGTEVIQIKAKKMHHRSGMRHMSGMSGHNMSGMQDHKGMSGMKGIHQDNQMPGMSGDHDKMKGMKGM